MYRDLNQTKAPANNTPLPISHGGTAASDIINAVKNLGGIPTAAVGGANGIAPLNSVGKISPQYFPPSDVNSVSVTGPSKITLGGVGHFTITDYDFDTNYTLETTHGQAVLSTINVDEIIYTPEAVVGPQGFTINGIFYHVNVIDIP